QVAPWLAAGAMIPFLALASYQWAAFGSPFTVGYAHLAPGTEYAAAQASGVLGVHLPDPGVAIALLAGAHRGLFVYAPAMMLAIPGSAILWEKNRQGALAAAAVGGFVVLLAVNSGYALWDGGASWGPRHLVPAMPLLAFLALPAAARWPRLTWTLV